LNHDSSQNETHFNVGPIDFCRGCLLTVFHFNEFLAEESAKMMKETKSSSNARELNLDNINAIHDKICLQKFSEYTKSMKMVCTAMFQNMSQIMFKPFGGEKGIKDFMMSPKWQIATRNKICHEASACSKEDGLFGPYPEPKDKCGWCSRLATDLHSYLDKYDVITASFAKVRTSTVANPIKFSLDDTISFYYVRIF
jgi:hypothetical protein